MSITSIGATEQGWQGTSTAAKRQPLSKEAFPLDSKSDKAPRIDQNTAEEKALNGLIALDGALESGNIEAARKSLESVRKSAGLVGEPIPGMVDPLSGVAKALKSGDVEAARGAWDDFQQAVRDEIDPEPDYSVKITGYSTFTIVA
ncbi:MAG: hypothetical protein RL318_921 [Fibrobacterota bacterium]|jgi:hypothetical protein